MYLDEDSVGTSPQTRLLLVSGDPRLAGEVRKWLEHARTAAHLEVCQSVVALSDTHTADLMLVAESGLPHRSAERIADEFARTTGKPVIFLGDAPGQGGRLHLLRKRGSGCVPFLELHRLPVVVEQTLRRFESAVTEQRIESEMQRAADAVGRSQKLVTIGRLAGSIAHEINNPLESITNLLYLAVQEPGLPPQARSYLELAQAELGRVVEISKQTLSFNRETASPVLVHAVDLLEEVLALYRRRVAEKHITVKREYASSAPVRVFPGEIRQVFSNLISNALEAMEANGTLRIRVHAGRMSRDGHAGALRISIADTGSGIPPDVLTRLGEPFFTTKGQRGTGLGLWVSQSIIRRHGGSLRMRSRVGERHGTVFTVCLPVDMDRVQQMPDPHSDPSHAVSQVADRRWANSDDAFRNQASGY